MRTIDPRAQLAALAAAMLGALFGGVVGIAAAMVAALATLALTHGLGSAASVTLAVAPLVTAIVALDALAGDPLRGALAAARLVALALVGAAFARVADGEALIGALRWMRLPYPATFVLVTGPRLVPLAAADLADLRDAARARGIDAADGPPLARLAAWRILLVPLLVMTIRRAVRLGEAMEARGFAPGRPRTQRLRLRWRRRDGVTLSAAVAYLALVIVAAQPR